MKAIIPLKKITISIEDAPVGEQLKELHLIVQEGEEEEVFQGLKNVFLEHIKNKQ